MTVNRRDFVRSAAGVAALGMVAGTLSDAHAQEKPAAKGPGGPVFVGSANALPSVKKAHELILAGGDPLDAVIAGINIVEDDEKDHSVGYGGLPNEDGVVELDACVMHGPTHRSGAVAALQRIKNPSSVAALVARRTDHCLLVGEGALKFARAHGFQEMNLLTEEARQIWLKWKESHSTEDDWLPAEGEKRASLWRRELGKNFTYGTITCMALTSQGDLFGCTSTSGLSYKLAGRVGDSPIIGAGLYVDNGVGACGSTGRGESNIQNLTSYCVVELMRQGRTPEEACKEALQRVADRAEKRLRNAAGEPDFGLTLYAVRKDGLVGGASMRGVGKMTVHDGKEARHVDIPGLYQA